jgi:hypothetical protein
MLDKLNKIDKIFVAELVGCVHRDGLRWCRCPSV